MGAKHSDGIPEPRTLLDTIVEIPMVGRGRECRWMVVPRRPWIDEELACGNTLRRLSCVHRVARPLDWLTAQRAAGSAIVGVELADGAVRLGDLPAARRRTVVVLGSESDGIPHEALPLLDTIVEIPMVGTGLSLNVAVAGSLVLYRLAGLV